MRLNNWSIRCLAQHRPYLRRLRRHQQLHTDFGFMALFVFDYE